MKEFEDKVVVVTGGNSGIGKAVAEAFDREGAKVVVCGRNQERLDETTGNFNQAIAVKADVSCMDDLDHLYKKTHEAFGSIDVLVVNAGVAKTRHVGEVDETFFDWIVDINFKGAFFTVQKSIPFLNRGASIVIISSVSAHRGGYAHSVYASTKAALSQLTKNFACDLIEQGIRVNAISPGYIDTPIFDERKREDPTFLDKVSQKIPAKRVAAPEEIAEAALYLSGQRGSYIVGHDLVVDGGLTRLLMPDKQ